MTRTLRRWTIVGGVAGMLLASACGGDDAPLPPPEADKLVETNPVTNTVEFYAPNDGIKVLPPGGDAQKAAMDWLEANKDQLGIPSPQDSFKPIETITDDEDHTTSVKLQLIAGGLPVWGIESVLHFDDDGTVIAFDGPFIPNLDTVAKQTPAIDEATAFRNAEAEIRTDLPPLGDIVVTPIVQELVVYVNDDYGAPALARHVRLKADSDRFMTPGEAFVDAMDGHVIEAWVDSEMFEVDAMGLDGLKHKIHVNGPYAPDNHFQNFRGNDEVSGYGFLVPGNWTGPKDGQWRDFKSQTQDGPWDRSAVDGELQAFRAEHFYRATYNWGRPNPAKNPLFVGMHLNNDGHWNAFAVRADDGSGDYINFTDALEGLDCGCLAVDVVGHEFTHLVTGYNSGLVYRSQPGSINEAMSDVFGSFVERSVFGRTPSVFLMGEATGKVVRDMRHPKRIDDNVVDNFGGLKKAPAGQRAGKKNDNGYVHWNSSIVNNAWALQVEGGTQDTTKVVVSHKTGWDSSQKLWWKTQRQLLTRRSSIPRMARVQSVIASRSKGRYDLHAVACSWGAVLALTSDWVQQKLRIRCDGLAPAEEAATESCDGRDDGVYCSTLATDTGFLCKNHVITVVKCNDGNVCKGALNGNMIVSCAAP